MYEWRLSLDAFLSWLCEREWECVGVPGRVFGSPLACWLEHVYGRLYGVDDYCCWRVDDERRLFLLPRWALLFVRMSERMGSFEMLTGGEAFDILSAVVEGVE